MAHKNYIHLEDCHIVAETMAAFLVEYSDEYEDVWIPKSQIADPETYSKGDGPVTISITEWIAEQKGIEV